VRRITRRYTRPTPYPQLEGLYERWVAAYLAENYSPDEAENDEADDGDEW
jgi:hypothetical protein